jgi:Family of unknown function (DUF6282)
MMLAENATTEAASMKDRPGMEFLKGAVDIHIHHAPDLYNRIQDPVELAKDARSVGIRAICIKRHNFPTSALAAMAKKQVPEVDIFGSIACNWQVGGLNPIAVESAIKLGARQIWMPTVHSSNHSGLTGVVGAHGKGLTVKGGVSEYTHKKPMIDLLDEKGRTSPELHEIMRLVAEADVIFNLGHSSFREMMTVTKEAVEHGVRRIVCDHPFFSKLSLEEIGELAKLGVFVNFTAGEILPRWWRASVEDFANAIKKIGVAHAVVSSDVGQLHNPPMVEALRLTAQLLSEEGFSAAEIRALFCENPAALLYP